MNRRLAFALLTLIVLTVLDAPFRFGSRRHSA